MDERYSLRYDGEVLNGGLETNEAIAVINGFSNLISECYIVINGPDSHPVVRLPSIRLGSSTFEFVATTLGIVQPVLQQIVGLGPSIKNASDLASAFLNLAKFLGGKKPESQVVTGDGNVILNNSSGSTIIINQNINNNFHDRDIGHHIENVAIPLRKHQRRLSVKSQDKPIFEVGSEEAPMLARPEPPDGPPALISTTEVIVKVKGPDLEGDGRWKFKLGRNVLTSFVEDADFLAKVKSGRESFANGDTFRIRIRTEQKRSGKRYRTRHYIEKIIERI